MEVPTIYKAYCSGLCQGISPQNMALYGTVPPFQDPEIPIELVVSRTTATRSSVATRTSPKPWTPRRACRRIRRDQKSVSIPIGSMYGIFTNICPKNHPNVGKYTIHGVYGIFKKDNAIIIDEACGHAQVVLPVPSVWVNLPSHHGPFW